MIAADWTIRPAVPADAAAACNVLRHSIRDLCQEDHGGDPDLLDAWLANKTPEIVGSWIKDNPDGVFVASNEIRIGGVGSVSATGEITLNYVAPWARFSGVSTGLMAAMETRVISSGIAVCTLVSTITAHRFYLARGYRDHGPPVVVWTKSRAFPMVRELARLDPSPTPGYFQHAAP